MNRRFWLLAGRRPSRLFPLATLSGLAVLALAPGAAQAAIFTVTKDKWGTSAIEGSFAWAIAQANSTPGADVIAVADGLQINVDNAIATSSPFNLATISESVTILGNNARLVGNPEFVNGSTATVVTKNNPQQLIQPPDILQVPSFSLLKIGTFNANNSAISVSISNLNTNGLNRIAQVNQGASLRYSGSAFEQSVNFTGGSTGCCFAGYAGSTISLDNVLIRDARTFNNPIDGSPITTDVFGNPRTTDGLRNVGVVQAQAPGPLPLLGVASAYGWCRRLRRRTQALRAGRRGRIEG